MSGRVPRSPIPASVDWNADQPRSRVFGDIYHAPDGAAEVDRAFMAPQRLTERLRECAGAFTIGELGFGTGLNFAVIAQRMLECAPPTARLHFISVERHPFSQRDFAAIARRRADLAVYAELARAYPPLIGGWHRRHFAGGRIALSVYFGDGAEGLGDIVGRQRVPVDAWLLDGFAPDRNPALWTDALWRTLAELSGTGTTVATFSAVGDVRRGLAAAGFAMRKIDQRPFKRHSLAGVFARHGLERPPQPTSAAVIGAGFAGAAIARQLAVRGIDVQLIDAAAAPPNRIATTLAHARLQPGRDPAAQLRCLAFLYAAHWHEVAHGRFETTGALQFAGDTLPPSRLDAIADAYAPTGEWIVRADPTTASAIAGIPLRAAGLYFPSARALDLRRVCAALTDHPRITTRYDAIVRSIATDAAAARVTTDATSIDCDVAVLCNGAFANEFDQARYLELVSVAGQIDRVDARGAARIALVGDGFALPHATGCSIGATYEHRPWDVARATAFNVERFERWQRALRGAAIVAQVTGVVRGTRAISSDRLPIVGALFDGDGRPIPRLAVSTGHGSQGTITAPLAAECVASELVGEFAPLTRDQYEVWSSMRFRERQARRGVRHGAREDVTDRTPVRS
jgi:tRNA 5-methylaminomethyl-2-thiouridine biosynthesis bifunctional protein